jgi:hypothetical protein
MDNEKEIAKNFTTNMRIYEFYSINNNRQA